jgi:hypothetical protein
MARTPETNVDNQIIASIEDVQALLDSNRKLSIAFLSRRIRDLEEDVRQRFREQAGRIASLEKAGANLQERLQQAGVKFKEMQEDMDQLKARPS